LANLVLTVETWTPRCLHGPLTTPGEGLRQLSLEFSGYEFLLGSEHDKWKVGLDAFYGMTGETGRTKEGYLEQNQRNVKCLGLTGEGLLLMMCWDVQSTTGWRRIEGGMTCL